MHEKIEGPDDVGVHAAIFVFIENIVLFEHPCVHVKCGLF